nr:MAG TPA: hypothetical protein [Caudoviricetes sp.]
MLYVQKNTPQSFAILKNMLFFAVLTTYRSGKLLWLHHWSYFFANTYNK